MGQKNRLTTLCYVENEGAYLMLHRVSRRDDVNRDKWTGVGGCFRGDESPKDCLLREVREETGLTLAPRWFRGLVTFKAEGRDTEYVCLYTVDKYEGEMITYNEGTLEWAEEEDMLSLDLWERNRIFFKLLNEDIPFFSLKLSHKGDWLTKAILNGKRVELFDVLDEDGRKTGVVRERSLVRMGGVPRRTAHIWIVRKNGGKTYDLPLQKRSRGKDSHPGCHDISSADHVQTGDELLPSTVRELKEELRIEAREEDLEFAGFHKGYMEGMFYGSVFRDSEVSTVCAYRKTVNTDRLTPQEGETESVMWMGLDQCVEVARNHRIPNCMYLDGLEMTERYLCRSQEK